MYSSVCVHVHTRARVCACMYFLLYNTDIGYSVSSVIRVTFMYVYFCVKCSYTTLD